MHAPFDMLQAFENQTSQNPPCIAIVVLQGWGCITAIGCAMLICSGFQLFLFAPMQPLHCVWCVINVSLKMAHPHGNVCNVRMDANKQFKTKNNFVGETCSPGK